MTTSKNEAQYQKDFQLKNSLTLYNTASRSKSVFTPIDPLRVRLYVCGPTVYGPVHLGNARSAVVFDMLYRVLRGLYPSVLYAQNITDVDDKIIAAARTQSISESELTQRTTILFQDDMRALHVLPPDVQPLATAFIPQMIAMIQDLIASGSAYAAKGHVLFDITRHGEYGRLSGASPEDLRAGARVEIAPYKKNPGDFVLWKPADPETLGWQSPWGYGRPGWHSECAAMSREILGIPFDIHGGGRDLLFPHHENECSQACALTGQSELARFWMHNGMLTVDGCKMSKSLGNFTTVQDARLRDRLPGEVIRWALLSAHYRQNLDWSAQTLHQARCNLDRLYRALANVNHDRATGDTPESTLLDDQRAWETVDPTVREALLDDLNTPLALHHLTRLAKMCLESEKTESAQAQAQTLLSSAQVMGLARENPTTWFQGNSYTQDLDETAIKTQIDERLAARKARDFTRADEIRKALAAQGIILEDTPAGTTWRRE